MEITVELTGYLPHTSQGKQLRSGRLTLPDQSTLAIALTAIGVPEKNPYIVTVNGKMWRKDQPIPEGAVICLIPPISGG